MFDATPFLMQIPSQDGKEPKMYLPVAARLLWFRSSCPQGTIKTIEVFLDLDRECTKIKKIWDSTKRQNIPTSVTLPGYARFKAMIEDGKGGYAEATGSESCVDFGDYIEKAETKAVGRALAMLGYGTQFVGYEFEEGERLADAPLPGKENGK